MVTLATRVILEGLLPIASGAAAYSFAHALGFHVVLAGGFGVAVGVWLSSKASFDAQNLLVAHGGDVRAEEALAFASTWIGAHALIPLAALGAYGGTLRHGKVAAITAGLVAKACVAMLVRRHFEGAPSNHVRGAIVKSLARMRKESARKLPPGDPGLPFGGIRLPSHRANAHFCFMGTPSSGKSVSIQLLMQAAFPRIGAGLSHRAVVFDSKIDALPQLEGLGLSCPIRTLNPLDARGYAWRVSRDITTRAHALELAEVLFPTNPKASQPFFDNAMRALSEAVVVSFIEHTPDAAWTLRDVFMTLLSPERIRAVLGRSAEGREIFDLYFANEKTSNDVMATVANGVNQYMIVASLWHHAEREGRALSLTEFVDSEGILVIGRSQVAEKALRHINQVIVRRLTQLILEKGSVAQIEAQADRTWVILDEFKALGRLPSIEDLMVMGRSAGACVVLGFQDWRGLCAVYEENQAHEIVGLCGHKAFLRLDGKENTRYASDSIGSVEWYEESTGPNGVSRSIQKRTRVLPNEFRELPKTGPKTGLHGYYMSDEDVWFAPLRGQDVFGDLARPAPIPSLVERDPGDQRPVPFSPADCDRLKLPRELAHAEEVEPGPDQDPEDPSPPRKEPDPDGGPAPRGGPGRISGLGRFRLDKDGRGEHEREGPG